MSATSDSPPGAKNPRSRRQLSIRSNALTASWISSSSAARPLEPSLGIWIVVASGSRRRSRAAAGTTVDACTGRARLRGTGADEHLTVHIRYPSGARESEAELELRQEAAEHVAHSLLPRQAEPEDVRTPEQHCPRAQRECLHDVGARPDAAVHQHLDPVADRVDYRRQSVDCGDGAVDLPPSVIRHYDGVHPGVGRAPGIVRMQDPLEGDRPAPVLAQEAEVIPGEGRVPEHGGPLLERREPVLVVHRTAHRTEEDAIGEVVLG